MHDDRSPKSTDEGATFFAPAGRSTVDELRSQVQRSLEDPCVKVVLEAVNGFVLVLNENRQILAANEELIEALDRHDPGCMVGLRFGEAFNCVHFTEGTDGCGTSPHCRTCGAVIAVLSAHAFGRAAVDECRLSFLRNGTLHALDLQVRATPLEIGGSRLTAFVLHDISAIKRRDVLEQTFLHDFLNMIGGIAGWSELLRSADRDTAAREIASLAEALKEEVLTHRTLLAAERGELVAKRRAFDVGALLAKLELLFTNHPVAHGKSLSVRLPENRVELVTDETLLLRVLVNMVKNALEAIEPGGVAEVWFEWCEGSATFVVRNSGEIAEAVKERIFERSFSTRAHEGRGIGTYSMKLFGERYLGGRVWFESDAANGTRFYVTLPAGVRRERAAAAPGQAAVRGRRLLLVDDDDVLLRLGILLLERLGCTVTACRSGDEALAALEAAPDRFDLVITDWTMPGASGAELVRRIAGVRGDLPVIVCSGVGELSDPAQRPSNVRAWLGKPFTMRQLAESLDAVVGVHLAG